MIQCRAKTRAGAVCSANAGESGYCWAHDPALARRRAEARHTGGKHRRRGENDAPFPPGDVKTAAGLLGLVECVMRETWTLENSNARNRTLGTLAGIQKSIIEVGSIEERLTALESRFNNGKQP